MPSGGLREAVRDALGSHSSCVPDGAVILTVLLPSYAQADLGTPASVRSLQFARVRSQRCLTRRIISLSFEARAVGREDGGIGTRVSARPFWNRYKNAISTIATFGTGISKYSPIAEALRVAASVLWLDPTVLLLSNPFTALASYGPARSADILYQAEAACWLTANSRSPSSASKVTPIEAVCARQQIYDRVVLVRNATIAAALSHLPYFARGRRTVGTRSELAPIVGAGAGEQTTSDDALGLVIRRNRSSWVGGSFMRFRAQALPLAFLMHSYDAFRLGIASACPPHAVAYTANQLSPSPSSEGPSRETRMAMQVATEMGALLDAVGPGGRCARGSEPTPWQLEARPSPAADAMIPLLASPSSTDVQRVIAALRAAPVVRHCLLLGLSALTATLAASPAPGVRGGAIIPPPDGLWLEFGSWRGASTKTLMHAACCLGRSTPIDAFDSFRGLPSAWRRGKWFGEQGSFDLHGKPPFRDDRVRWHIGWFNHTLPAYLASLPSHRQVSFLSIDCDIYQSASLVLSLLEERLAPGCVIVFDELFNYVGFEEHEMRALIDLLRRMRNRRRMRVLGTNAERILESDAELTAALACRQRGCMKGLGQSAVVQLL
jgi:hypothetical protein